LDPYETCVSGDTLIQTKLGAFPIKKLVDFDVEVFNGKNWSQVKPFLAKKLDKVYRITFSDGSILDANEDHEFQVTVNKNTKVQRVKTLELIPKVHKLPRFSLPSIEGDCDTKAYTLGAFMGDGYLDNEVPFIFTPESKYSLIEEYKLNTVSVYKEQLRESGEAVKRVRLNIETDIAKELRDRTVGLPSEIMSYNKASALSFIAGLIDTDGGIRSTNGVESYAIWSTSIAKLRDAQILLRRAGINSTSIILDTPKENKGNKGRNFDLYKLSIHTFECKEIPTKLKMAKTFGDRFQKNNAHPEGAMVDQSKRVSISSVEYLGEMPVYCFTENELGMGVFGNVLTYQCCLAEVFLPNVSSKEEFLDILELLYRINKHSLLLPSHHPETTAIVHKNMRMGIGLTGILQATSEQNSWLEEGYEYLRDFDERYSEMNDLPTSIKLTTVKPSGTLSLLPGVTPGIHPAYARYMYRRIRIASSHPLVAVCKEHGYPMEYVKNFDGSEDYNTMVVTFPFSYPEGTKLASEMTALDQLKEIRRLQEVWSDNSVSCTIYYRKEEIPVIKEYLAKHYRNNHKSLSFLLHNEHGFAQAPYEEISEDTYNELVRSTRKITGISSAEFEAADDCASGACPIR
jgi:hypothetical protein